MFHFKKYKKLFLFIVDVLIIAVSYWVTALIRFNFNLSKEVSSVIWSRIPIVLLIYVVLFSALKLYSSLWTVAGLEEYVKVVTANIAASLLTVFFGFLIAPRVPLSISLFSSTLILLGTLGFRIIFRIYRRLNMIAVPKSKKTEKNILIIGAGEAAALVIKEVKNHRQMNIGIVGLLDDDDYKQNAYVGGYPVLGKTEDVIDVVDEFNVDEIIFAIPSIPPSEKKRILELSQKSKAKLKTLPGMYELVQNGFSYNQIRDVDVTDLLGRKEIILNNEEIKGYITGKVVLVTGGGGSIGSELCRQITQLMPKRLIIVDIYENNAYDIQNELLMHNTNLDLKVLIASVRDREKIDSIFESEKPDVVFHAAAHKHVPLMETSPGEAIKNNVFGTLNVAQAAAKFKVQKFILISTDKAVNPTNIMGATKRLCEMIIQTMNAENKDTDYVAVRFGNVLGSNGSVIPLFKKQIADGGPVTLTHKEITRYFMTIPEAVQLVLQAGSYAQGGEIFVLDMGQPVKIYDLAENLIRLSGFTPNVDMDIEITGLRPGEKLYEELLMAEEGLSHTRNPLIFVGKPNTFNAEKLMGELMMLKTMVHDYSVKNEDLKQFMKKIVNTYEIEIENKEYERIKE